MELKPGICGHAELTVTEENTALALGSGTLKVLATPAVAALAEKTCWQSVAPALEPGQSTVGTKLDLAHNAPTPVGGKVVCDSKLTALEGRRLIFHVNVSDMAGSVAEILHERFLVTDEKFQAKAQDRLAK
jgi:fluoroacetyl-CoA thioesterase